MTEHRNPRSAHIDRLSVEDAFDVINAEDRTVADAVAAAKPQICEAVAMIAGALDRGGRLMYVGAGTSGRLGVIDAAECPPTFMTPPEMVQGVIAGGYDAMWRSIEGAEDCADAAAAAMTERNVGPGDVVFGIATGGTTPFVHVALQAAKARGARTIFLACVPPSQQGDGADLSIRVLTGPEVITGSTRLKAGTATKLVLNTLTTLTMVRLGKVYGNLMVDLNRQACAKLHDRGVRIVQVCTDLPRASAEELLSEAGDVKTALVMHALGVAAADARARLDAARGRLSDIVDPAQ